MTNFKLSTMFFKRIITDFFADFASEKKNNQARCREDRSECTS